MPRYSVLLLPDVEAGGYTVEVPSLPGVVTEGDTREEALANAQEAISLFLEDMVADGEAIPEERARPEIAEVDVPMPTEAVDASGSPALVGAPPK
jgi:antitoxin HicB